MLLLPFVHFCGCFFVWFFFWGGTGVEETGRWCCSVVLGFFSPYQHDLKISLRMSTALSSLFCVLEAATCCECWESKKLGGQRFENKPSNNSQESSSVSTHD